ncbi:MAG: DUF5074 domain-containing protein [Bacteroidaceae bacterium]|nr:DUF5074 domain-containing protein [Bacteroidaceae bacterium]
MKKLLLFIALSALALSGTAQTIHKVQGIERADLNVPQLFKQTRSGGTGINFQSIQTWVGDVEDIRDCNQAALAVRWHDGNGYTNTYVWGYRWETDCVKTGADMIAQIAKEDPRFYYLVYGGTWSYTDSTRTDSIYTGSAMGGIGYCPTNYQSISLNLNGQPYPLIQGAVHTNAYNFDSWTSSSTNGYWNAGWYTNGYWSYWNAIDASSSYGYASTGCSGRTLTDGCVDGWVFAYDFDWNADMGDDVVYVSALSPVLTLSKARQSSERIESKAEGEGSTKTISTVKELYDAISAAVDGDVFQFDESLRGQEIDATGVKAIKFTKGYKNSVIGNGVILKNFKGFVVGGGSDVLIKDFVFDNPSGTAISYYDVNDKLGYATIENCTFRNYDFKGNKKLISCWLYNIIPNKNGDYIKITNCLFENNTARNEDYHYYNGLMEFVPYVLDDKPFKVSLVNNTFRGNKASTNSCLTAANSVEVELINNVFENNKNTNEDGVDIEINENATLTTSYNVISSTINDVYKNQLSETDKWAADLEASLELIDGKYNVKKGSPAYQNLPANTVIEGVEFPTTDIYGNTIDYTKPVNAGCSQLVYAPVVPVDYTNGTFILNEDWFGHQNSTMNFLTAEGEMIYRVIQRENEGVELGCTAQYGTIYGDKMYITSKQDKDGGAKITGGRLTIADAKTLKVEKQFQTISANGYTGKADGRAFLGVNEHKGYMGTSNGIFILDLDKLEFTDFIKVPNDDEDLYTGQVGNMVRVNDYVFANHQNAGLLVINAETDKIEKTIKGPDDALIGTFTLAGDGNLYLMTSKNLLCLDPATLEYTVVDLPEGTKLTNESWGAWTPSTLCASRQQNAIFWGTASGWTGAEKVMKYDIDKKECSTYFDLSDSDWRIYGCSFRIDPVTDEGIASLFKGYGDQTYVTRKYNAAGEVVAEYPMEKNYWFPSLAIYPDNAVPVVSELEPQTLYEGTPMEISLADFATDADNMTAAIVKTVKAVSDVSVLNATITNGTLVITPLKNGTATVTIQVNSNGKLAESDILVEVTKPTGVKTIHTENATPTQTYSLDGKIVGGSYRGVVIVKMSDGTTHKVVR